MRLFRFCISLNSCYSCSSTFQIRKNLIWSNESCDRNYKFLKYRLIRYVCACCCCTDCPLCTEHENLVEPRLPVPLDRPSLPPGSQLSHPLPLPTRAHDKMCTTLNIPSNGASCLNFYNTFFLLLFFFRRKTYVVEVVQDEKMSVTVVPGSKNPRSCGSALLQSSFLWGSTALARH